MHVQNIDNICILQFTPNLASSHVFHQLASQKTITNYQKANWTSFKRHVEDFIFYRPHCTNVYEANEHLFKAILDTNRFSSLKEITTQITLTHAYLQAYPSLQPYSQMRQITLTNHYS